MRFAEGAAGLIWFGATAVVQEGKANPRQLLLSKETAKDFQTLLQDTLKASEQTFGLDHRPYTVLQLTHSGRYSKRFAKMQPIVAVANPSLEGHVAASQRIITKVWSRHDMHNLKCWKTRQI